MVNLIDEHRDEYGALADLRRAADCSVDLVHAQGTAA